MKNKELTKGEKFIVDWQYGLGGSFKITLAQAISFADTINLAKLHLAFPEEVKAFTAFSTEENWWLNLQKKIKGKLCEHEGESKNGICLECGEET